MVHLWIGTVNGAYAHSAGQVGQATTGCSCHAVNADATTTVSFDAKAPTLVGPGALVALTLSVASTNAARDHGGLNVEADAGTLTAGANTKVSGGEITHPQPEAFAAGAAVFEFTWTAPLVDGIYTLYAAGNAVNDNGLKTGDGWNFAPDLVIEVDSGCDDLDADGVDTCNGDCDDNNAAISPNLPELCDALDVDENCDKVANDESAADASSWWFDEDLDGYGAGTPIVACDAPLGHVAQDGDCNDADPAYYPGANEPDCTDPTDYNCDGSTGFADVDGDGYSACLDCNDLNSAANPLGTEVCNGTDDDCDGTTDEPDAVDALTFYLDVDGDGYGTPSGTAPGCTAPDGFSATTDDCDDGDPTVNPTASEIWYDSVDQNCDGNDDDQDGDGFAVQDECDDANAAVYPGANDVWYDGIDADCAGDSDYDQDGDGADAAAPDGTGDDCDDRDANVYPEADDPICDGIDLDCDPAPDTDPGCDGTTSPPTDTGTSPYVVDPPFDDKGPGCGCANDGTPVGSFALLAGIALLTSLRAPRSRW